MEPPNEKTGMEKRLDTLAAETEKQKKALVEQLQKTPIVQLACERTGVGRSTYYQWRAKDKVFARAAERALEAGQFLVNDMAESRLMALIKADNLTAIIFWLKHNHPKYAAVNRLIHEHEIVTNRMSTEERVLAERMIAEDMARDLLSRKQQAGKKQSGGIVMLPSGKPKRGTKPKQVRWTDEKRE